MQIGRREWRDALRDAACRRHCEDRRLAFVRALIVGPHHLAIERQHVVVVVADRESRVDEARLTGREIETIEPAARLRIRAARVVDQRRTVWRPIRRLEGLLRAEDDLAVPATYVEQLES